MPLINRLGPIFLFSTGGPWMPASDSPHDLSPVMIAGVVAELRGHLDNINPDNYRAQLGRIADIAGWAAAGFTYPREESDGNDDQS